jgi:hypothetical protein
MGDKRIAFYKTSKRLYACNIGLDYAQAATWL